MARAAAAGSVRTARDGLDHEAPPTALGPCDRPTSCDQPTSCDRPQLVVTLMCLVVGLVFASGTVLFTSLPDIAQELGATQTDAQWLANAYPLVIAALLMPAGALIDRGGRKRGCIFGLLLIAFFFFAASEAQTATSAIWLLAAAGLGGAFAFPATLATITAVLPKERRGTAVGIWSASMLAGGAVGAAGGGLLTEVASRQWVLASPAIIAVLLLPPTLIYVPESREEERRPLDIDGAVLSALGVGLLVLGLTYAPERGFGDPLTLSMFAGLLFLLLFVRWSLVSPYPLLDVRLLTEGRFGMGSFVNVLTWFLAYGAFFLAVQYRSYTLDYGPLTTGASLFPLMILTIPLGAVGPRLARRYGARLIMVIGMVMLSGGSLLIAWAATTETFWWVALAEMIAFGGLGLSGGPAAEAVVDGLPPSKQGVASAVNDTTRELGVALGVAFMGSLYNFAYRSQVDSNSTALPEEALEATRDSAAAGLQVAAGLPGQVAVEQTDVIRSAAASGLTLAMLVAAGILALSAVVVWRCHPDDRPAVSDQAIRSKREMRARIAHLEQELQRALTSHSPPEHDAAPARTPQERASARSQPPVHHRSGGMPPGRSSGSTRGPATQGTVPSASRRGSPRSGTGPRPTAKRSARQASDSARKGRATVDDAT